MEARKKLDNVYKWGKEQGHELKICGEERKIVLEIIELLREKKLTVDISQSILQDAKVILPLIARL